MSGNETEAWPEMNQAVTQRILTAASPAVTQPGAFDPYKAMLMKKQVDDGKPVDTSNVVKWPNADIKQLEDFCMRMGIVGFKTSLPPIVALGMLKSKLGVLIPSPVEVIVGRYEDRMNQKTLLKG